MVVAVSGAGGLGSLPGTPLTPQKLREGARPRARTRVCERTVFAPAEPSQRRIFSCWAA